MVYRHLRGTKRPDKKLKTLSSRRVVPIHDSLIDLGLIEFIELLKKKVSDVMNESGTPKTEVKVKQKKTGKTTLSIPLSPNSVKVIKDHLSERQLTDFIFTGQMSHFTRKPITSQQYAKIVKNWMRSLGIEDVSQYSTHSIRKSKPTLIYNQTKNVDAVRRLLGQSSVTATSAYLGTSDESSLDLARTINI